MNRLNTNCNYMNRDFRIDLLRVFACIMVLFCHAPQPFNGQSGQYLIAINNYFGMAWGPILFFMISGACVLWNKKEAIPFLKKRFARILIPIIFWSIIYVCIECFWWHSVPIDDFWRKIIRIPFEPQYGVMWFMYALIGLYLITPILSQWLAHTTQKEIEFYIIIWLITLSLKYFQIFGVNTECIFEATNMFYYFSGFVGYAVIGFYSRKYLINLRYNKTNIFISVLILCSPLYYFLIKQYTGMVFNSSLYLFQMATTVFAFVFLYNIKLPKSLTKGIFRNLIEEISNLSFGIYLTHMLCVYPFRIWIAQFNLHYAIQIPITVCITFFFSVIISWIISKFSFGKYIIGL